MEEALECCGDKGYSCTEERVTLTDESVTTIDNGDIYAFLSYEEPITSGTIKVTFDGTEYICNKSIDGLDWTYSNSDSPFTLSCSPVSNMLYTETVGTYQVKIEAPGIKADVTECFKVAVLQATKEAIKGAMNPLILAYTADRTLSKTFKTIADAYLAGRSVLLDPIVPSKSYYSMVSLKLNDYSDSTSGGEIVFGGETTQTFTASTASDFPTKKTS